MNRYISSILLAGASLIAVPAATSLSASAQEMVVYKVVDTHAKFPGGDTALSQWLGKNLRYPAAAQEQGAQGTVKVKFVVTNTGDIVNPEIEESVFPALDSEALRLVQKMPMWEPGKSNGVPVNSYVVLPVTFRLNDVGGSAPKSSSISNIKIGGATSEPAARPQQHAPAEGSFGVGNIKIGGSKKEADTSTSTYRPSLSSHFERMLNGYPADFNFFQIPDIRNRLIALMGPLRFDYMVANFDYEYPIEKVRDAYSVMACKSGKCGVTDFEIQYLPYTNNLCVKYNVDGDEEVFMEEKAYVKWTQYTDQEE